MKSQNPLIKPRIKNGSKPTYQDQRLALNNMINASILPLCNKIDTSFLPTISTQRKTKSTRNPLIKQRETKASDQQSKRLLREIRVIRDRSQRSVVVDILNGNGDRRSMEARGRKIYEMRERESCEPESVALGDLMKWEKESKVRVRGIERREKQILKY